MKTYNILYIDHLYKESLSGDIYMDISLELS